MDEVIFYTVSDVENYYSGDDDKISDNLPQGDFFAEKGCREKHDKNISCRFYHRAVFIIKFCVCDHRKHGCECEEKVSSDDPRIKVFFYDRAVLFSCAAFEQYL